MPEHIIHAVSAALAAQDYRALVRVSGRIARLAALLQHESDDPCIPACPACEDAR
jgi:hypothetical protein